MLILDKCVIMTVLHTYSWEAEELTALAELEEEL